MCRRACKTKSSEGRRVREVANTAGCVRSVRTQRWRKEQHTRGGEHCAMQAEHCVMQAGRCITQVEHCVMQEEHCMMQVAHCGLQAENAHTWGGGR